MNRQQMSAQQTENTVGRRLELLHMKQGLLDALNVGLYALHIRLMVS